MAQYKIAENGRQLWKGSNCTRWHYKGNNCNCHGSQGSQGGQRRNNYGNNNYGNNQGYNNRNNYGGGRYG